MEIKFYPSSEETSIFIPPPKPAATYIPKWYRDIPKFSKKEVVLNEHGRLDGMNVKSCVPFLDSMMSGYIQETWQDIAVEHRNGRVQVSCPTDPRMLSTRNELSIPVSEAFYQIEFVWKAPWMPRLPKGWSMLYTSPLNHVELPWETGSGVQDSDNFYHSPFGNLPFYIKYGFTGIIPAGTPMYQMIPVKRESWKSEVMPWDKEGQYRRVKMIATRFEGAYRDLFHAKKEYR